MASTGHTYDWESIIGTDTEESGVFLQQESTAQYCTVQQSLPSRGRGLRVVEGSGRGARVAVQLACQPQRPENSAEPVVCDESYSGQKTLQNPQPRYTVQHYR